MMYDYQAKLERVTDGDTVRYLIDMGMYVRSAHAIRLLGVFAPELNDPGGREARAFVSEWHAIHQHDESLAGWPYLIVTEKDRQTFNRYIGVVTCMSCGAPLNDDVNTYLESQPYRPG